MPRVVARFPFKHLEACPNCGSTDLKIVHNQKYPDEDGIYQLVLYRCPNGHQTPSRQLVIKQKSALPKKEWEGWI